MRPDFSSRNLRGRSLRDQDLTGADFSFADIRGVDFSHAILKGANFTHARAGLPPQRIIGLMLLSLLLSVVAGSASGLAGIITSNSLSADYVEKYGAAPGLVVLFVLLAFYIGVLRLGYSPSLMAAGLLVAGLLALVMAIAWLSGGSLAPTGTARFIAWTSAIAGVLSTAGAAVGGGAVGSIAAVASANLAVGNWAEWVALLFTLLVALLVTIGLPILNLVSVQVSPITPIGVILAIAIACLGAYTARRAMQGDPRFAFNRAVAIAFASLGGTRFYRADLSEANFTRAILKSTDLRQTVLTHTQFHRAQKLDQARVGGTILADRAVLELLVSHRGAGQSYSSCDLRGANLQGADLSNANLMGADLSHALLKNACLERANLTKVRAIQTDFRQAQFTAACLEAWTIDATTQLDNTLCDFVYLKHNQQERRPNSGTFAAGDFARLFQEVLDTVELILHAGLDWKALAVSLNQVQATHPDQPLSVRSIENKGDGTVVVSVNVAPNADKATLHAELSHEYQTALQLLEERYRAELQSKDDQIALYRQHQHDLREMMQVLTGKPPTPNPSPTHPHHRHKLVTLKLGNGNFASGFPVILQIGDEGTLPSVEVTGRLPAAPHIAQQYRQWQMAYRRGLQTQLRLGAPPFQVTNFSQRELLEECRRLGDELQHAFQKWLTAETFRPLRERLLEQLHPTDSIRVILQTEDDLLQRLPWQNWDFFERYSQAEVALSTPSYETTGMNPIAEDQVHILAVLGSSTGLDLQKDREALAQIPNAKVTFLVEPSSQELGDRLWEQSWHILFFAGHSSSHTNGSTGQLSLNATDSITIPQLKHALKHAVRRGLRLAIFNSCDGLGLANNLADLHMPQVIVMREPIPDRVAQSFVQHFLKAFAAGMPLYQAMRTARERLHSLEANFPCATWLPIICQNPAEPPSCWGDFLNAAAVELQQ